MQYTKAATLSNELLLKELKTRETGLNSKEVKENRAAFGANTLSIHETKWWEILFNQLNTSFVYLLLAASLISFLLGEEIDAAIILGFVLINSILGFWQEYKASESLSKLRKLITKTSTVLRDNKELTINDVDFVVGDILMLKAGDLIPAEVRFISAYNLGIDESLLTGESAPVSKSFETLKEAPTNLRDATNIGFSGTLLTKGEAKAVVIAVGNQTELGLISKLALETETQTAFSKQLKKISRAIIILMAATILAVFVLHFFIKGPELKIGELAVFSIALAVGVVPEALPLVVTISLSTGAVRLAKKKVVPRRLSAIEDLGGIQILCTDKTGTITKNSLTVTDVYPLKNESEALKLALYAATFEKNNTAPSDPFDKAIFHKISPSLIDEIINTEKEMDSPFDPVRRRNSVLIKTDEGRKIIVRGAYEEISKLCTNLSEFDEDEIKSFLKNAGREGKRILAVAVKEAHNHIQSLEKEENELKLVGLLAFLDPLKDTAADAIKEAEELGIRIKILTGDALEVSESIGRSIGLIESEKSAMTGDEYEKLSENERTAALESVNVFARVSPQQKFIILRDLQKSYSVGFLGEGFNDAPGLKAADVALVVDNASDVAKNNADIILLSKDLQTIIDGVKEGRRTAINMIKYIRATLTSNFGNFFALAFSSLFIPFLPMLPIQILLVNLLTDFPMISISTDNVSENALKKPRKDSLKSILMLAVVLGLISTVFDLATFSYYLKFGERTVQTMWFMESILTELILLFSIRSTRVFFKTAKPSYVIILLTTLAAIFTIAIPFTQIGRSFFNFVTPSFTNMATVTLIVSTYFVLTETGKLLYFKINKGE